MIQNVNAVNRHYLRLTALMIAARNNHLDMVISLMNHSGIDLNVQGRYNVTALHWAVNNNHPAIVAQLLSDDRIDCTLKDDTNRTPLKVATFKDNLDKGCRRECVKILREHGAPEE